MCRTLTNGAGWSATLIACLGLAFVAFSGCAHPLKKPPCVSACGMLLEDEGNGAMDCDHLQEAEDKLLESGDELMDKDQRLDKNYACGQIFGWQLKLHDEVIGIDNTINNGIPFVGMSSCGEKVMHLMANQSWRKGSYPHEYFHMIQECNPPMDWHGSRPGHGGGHNGWDDNGVYDLIQDFREGRR